MVHQRQKTRMKDPVLGARYIGHHCFWVINNHPAGDAAIKRQRSHKGIQNHLLRFPRIGYHKRFAAVAQAEMGNLYLLVDATQDNMLFTPVKLEGIADLELQRTSR